MPNFHIEGVVAPVFTPIKTDGSINFGIISRYIKFLVERKVKTILVGGTSGESMCLNVSDRKILAVTWLLAAKPHRVKVIIQVGGTTLPDVLELARHAEENKSHAILTLPELYFKPSTAEQLVSYLELVSKAAPSLPLYYYHYPKMSGVTVNVKHFVTLATRKIPNFRGLKADIDVATQLAKENRTVFIGNHFLSPAALLGFRSSIATVTNLCPELVHKILEAVEKGNVLEARDLQMKLNDLVDDISSEGDWVPSMKFAMGLVTGLDMGPPLLPLRPLTDDQKNRIQTKLTTK